MDDKEQRIIENSAAGFFTDLTYGALILLIGAGFGYLLGIGLSRAVRSMSARKLTKHLGVTEKIMRKFLARHFPKSTA